MLEKIIDLEKKLSKLVAKHEAATTDCEQNEVNLARDPEYTNILEELARAYEEQGGCCGKGNAEYLRDLIREAKGKKTHLEEYVDYYYLTDTRDAGM